MYDDTQSQFEKGISHLNGGDIPAAIEAFSRVIGSTNVTPQLNAMALNHRGFAYFQIQNFDAATSDWAAVLGQSDASEEMKQMESVAMGRITSSVLLKQAESKKVAGDTEGQLQSTSKYLTIRLDMISTNGWRPRPCFKFPTFRLI